MARSTLSKLAIAVGTVLLLVAVVLFTNGYFCTFNKVSCGMVEPLIAVPVGVLGVSFAIAGLLGIRHGRS
jgi:hypothetical protein